MPSFIARVLLASIGCGLVAGCASDELQTAEDGIELPASEAASYSTAYLARVVPAPEGDDLKPGAGEYVVIANSADIKTDMGGWYVEDRQENRLSVGVGRQLEVNAHLKVYSSCGEDTKKAVFACADGEVLDDSGDVLTLRDSSGSEVATFDYNTEAP